MARNPKPLRGKDFEAWYQARLKRAEDDDGLGWLNQYFMSNLRRAGKLYKAHLDYRKICSRWTRKGWPGYNCDGQWLRRESKKRRTKWKRI